MSKPGKAEPSMEEILSSIRKIIAEEPASARPAAQALAPASSALLGTDAMSASPVTSAQPAPTTPLKSSIDDILDLADAAPRSDGAATGPSEGARNGSSIPSWLFPTSRSESEAKAETTTAAAPKGPAEPPREAPKPFFPSASAAPVANPLPQPVAQSKGSVGLGAVNGTHAATVDEPARGDDLGAVVPKRSPEAASPAGSVLDRRTPQAGLPDWLSRSAAIAAKPAAPEPVAAPVEPTRLAGREPEAAAPALSELARPAAGSAAGAQNVPRAQTLEADAGSKAGGAVSSGAATLAKAEAPAIAMPPTAADVPVAATVAAAAPEAAEAAVSEKGPIADLGAPAAEKTGHSVVIAEGPAFGTVPKPTLLNERGRTPKAGVPGDMLTTMVQPTGVRTLDDTIIDLLRPMIRQWLDDNMPRMVEKALRVELAASVKSKTDQAKH